MRRSEQFQKIVPHRPQTVYSAVSDVESYSAFLPYCRSSNIVDRVGHGDETCLTLESTFGFQMLTSRFLSRVHLTPDRRVRSDVEANTYIEASSFNWSFSPVGEHACCVDLAVDFGLRRAEHLLVWEMAKEKIISDYVRTFTQRCVQLEARKRSEADGAQPPPASLARAGCEVSQLST